MSFGFKVDSNNVLGGGFVDEAGTYNVKVLDTTEVTTTKGGKPMITVNYEVVDGAQQGRQVRYDNLVWSEDNQEAMERSIRRFNTMAIAVGAKDGAEIKSIDAFRQGLIGKQLNIAVDWTKNEYSGKYNLTVKSHRVVDPEGSKPNGNKRPDSNQQQSSGFGQSANQPQQSNPFVNQPVDIDDSQLPF